MTSEYQEGCCRWCGKKIVKNRANDWLYPHFHSQTCAARMGLKLAKEKGYYIPQKEK